MGPVAAKKGLLKACSRVVTQMEETASVLRHHGPYALHSEPFPEGAAGLALMPLSADRASLISATRRMLNSLRVIRLSARKPKANKREALDKDDHLD